MASHAGSASAPSQPQQAIGPDLASRVAALAQQAETARLTPQDIEWALAGDRLWLLQSRPIPVLPVAPDIEAPTGTWQKDAAHFPEPISPFAASALSHNARAFLADAIATWGLLLGGVPLDSYKKRADTLL